MKPVQEDESRLRRPDDPERTRFHRKDSRPRSLGFLRRTAGTAGGPIVKHTSTPTLLLALAAAILVGCGGGSSGSDRSANGGAYAGALQRMNGRLPCTVSFLPCTAAAGLQSGAW